MLHLKKTGSAIFRKHADFVDEEQSPEPGNIRHSSRKARRKILPTLVLGSSLRNSTCFGTL